jgi:two-component system, chemotaxis family, protein-glutamate methylesterase/glutaminase
MHLNMKLPPEECKYNAIVIGSSAGGLNALTTIFEKLPVNYPLPIVVVQHRAHEQEGLLEEVLQSKCKIAIKQADEKESIGQGCIYIAPPGYHLLIEKDFTFSLSADAHVNYSRPSIDILFETAAEAYKETLIGLILTGANTDGATGMLSIKNYGGFTIAQDPKEAFSSQMPKACIANGSINVILNLQGIQKFFMHLYNQATP